MAKMTTREIRELPQAKALAAERAELVRLAKPLYVEMLKSVKFYADKVDDDRFWEAYIGSRVIAARELVATSLGKPFQGEQPRPTAPL